MASEIGKLGFGLNIVLPNSMTYLILYFSNGAVQSLANRISIFVFLIVGILTSPFSAFAESDNLIVSEFELAKELGLEGRPDTFPYRGKGYRILMHSDRTYIIGVGGRTAVLFEFSGDNSRDYRVNRIYSPLSQSELLTVFDKVESQDLMKIKGFIVDHSDPSSREIDWIEIPTNIEIKIVGRNLIGDRNREADYAKLDSNKRELAEKIVFGDLPFSSEIPVGNSLMIGQAEYGIISSVQGGYDLIGTFGVANCVGVVLVSISDSKSSVAVAHFDAMTNVSEQMQTILSEMPDSSNLRAWLTTSQLDASLMLRIVNSLEANSIPIEAISDTMSEIAVDLQGNLFRFLPTGKSSGIVMQSVGGKLRRVN